LVKARYLPFLSRRQPYPILEGHLELLGLLAIPVLIIINAMFVAAEFSLVAVRRTRIEELVKQGVRGAKAVDAALTHLDRSIAATQLGITIASIALGAIGQPAVAELLIPVLSFLPENLAIVGRNSIAAILAVLCITITHVIFGELFPKTVALQRADRVSLWLATPLNVFAKICSPIIHLMNAVANFMLRRVGLRPAGTTSSIHSTEELRLLIEDTQEAGLIQSDQAVYLQNVFSLQDKTVRQCMLPREKMDAIEISTPSEKILEVVRDCGHTRLPVYRETLDNIVGVLNTKNLFYFFSLQNAVVLEDALYPATYLDPDENLGNAIRLFRKSRRPMALVRDKDGRILGLITLEDVLEEIVGDIEDEHDVPVPTVPRTKLSPRVVRSGTVPKTGEQKGGAK
jgi:CBS domain containing-hemolysin-like protein